MPSYFAVVHRTPTNEFTVQFPDCPGCTATGASFAEAERRATEALRRYLDALIAEASEPPEPSDIAAVKVHPLSRGGVVIAVPVTPVRRNPGRKRRAGGASAAERSGRKAAPQSG